MGLLTVTIMGRKKRRQHGAPGNCFRLGKKHALLITTAVLDPLTPACSPAPRPAPYFLFSLSRLRCASPSDSTREPLSPPPVTHGSNPFVQTRNRFFRPLRKSEVSR